MFVANKHTAVVILSYNSRKWHELFLPKICSEAGGDYEVFLVDHASPDDTSEFVRTHFPEVRLIQLKENHGFAWGYAQALNQIQAKYYVLLSSDFEVTDNWFTPLLHRMEHTPQLAALQPKIRYYKDRQFFEYAGAAGGFMDKWGYMFCRGRIFDTLESDNGQYDDAIEVFWASGGCLMVRSAVYHKVGGLDPDLFAHMEEIDLCWRMKNAGYKIGVEPSSLVFHVGGSIITYGSPQKTFYNFRNNLILLIKNEKSTKLWWLFPLRLVLDGIAGLQFLLKGQTKNMWAIVSAHFSLYATFFKWYNKRQSCKFKKATPNTSGVFQKSIIAQYFLKKKKHFSDLEITTKKL